MREFARQRKLRRWILRVPFLSLSLSSRWLTLITPVYAAIGRCLIESVRNPSVVLNRAPWTLSRSGPWESRARSSGPSPMRIVTLRRPAGPTPRANGAGGALPEPGRDLLINEQTARVPLAPAQAFAPIRRIGGRTGWYYGNLLWKIRGLIDLMMGGVGMRRGRPDPETPCPGSTWTSGVWSPTSLAGGFDCLPK